MTNINYLEQLSSKSSFNRTELHKAMESCGEQISEASFKKKLQELLKQHEIIRVGRNAWHSRGQRFDSAYLHIRKCLAKKFNFFKTRISHLHQHHF